VNHIRAKETANDKPTTKDYRTINHQDGRPLSVDGHVELFLCVGGEIDHRFVSVCDRLRDHEELPGAICTDSNWPFANTGSLDRNSDLQRPSY
jgi:hypothetical protein